MRIFFSTVNWIYRWLAHMLNKRQDAVKFECQFNVQRVLQKKKKTTATVYKQQNITYDQTTIHCSFHRNSITARHRHNRHRHCRLPFA